VNSYTLALCFDAPMQSWGVRSRHTIRDTAREPTKSGVVGLLCAALGAHRDDRATIERLARMRMGVRVDREGILERDYQTAQDVPTTTGGGHRTVVSHRYYLADALFLVVLEDSDRELLGELADAVRAPKWPLFFGRRAFVPARPLIGDPADGHRSGLGLSDRPLDTVLAEHPWLELRIGTPLAAEDRVALRTVVDCAPGDERAELRQDLPVSFARESREFRVRAVRTGSVPLTDSMIAAVERACT
jgi:CRISPR system Cascade subunit CasD